MKQSIPGRSRIEGREFFYVETFDSERFRTIVDAALSGSLGLPLPSHGGIIEEKVRLVIADGTSLMGISYKGDLEAWRTRLVAYCKETNRTWGVLSEQTLVLSDGRVIDLRDCSVIPED